ncbi:NADPH-dependent FMN reductase [Streptomyces hoynatensis]|uniref:NADPH-dependent oxidoreductase n=1 Tax=Streptomyces hoynatensis TaxID=1141874 RepID=A0A3A9ZDF6_9ACTN|nr:NAD(P)H-dependent oxidoreductase [Streptomyces hoynatensis]RKN45804.1 NADPH-dependent oxidoreductase [Streptomyces hoynatensis]
MSERHTTGSGKPRVGIVIGSTRPGRVGPEVARWFHGLAVAHTDAARFELVDLADFELPLLDEPEPALGRTGPGKPHTSRWAARVGELDAFVFVTTEYNRAAPAALKNAIDFLAHEWAGKAVGFVGYGAYGALQAVDGLRAIAGTLRMADIGPQVVLSIRTDFRNFTEFAPQDHHEATVKELVDELLAWTAALRPLRAPAAAA